MSEPTFKEGIEALVSETMESYAELPDGMTISKAEYEFHDVLGYQVLITIGKGILEKEDTDEEDGY